MSLSIHTNFTNMVTQNQLSATNKAASTAMQRLGTGLRINSSADDAAGLQVATRLKSQSNGQKVAMRNAQDAISMMQTAEGAMDEMTNIVQRMKDLATQAANGTSTEKDIAAMNAEFGELTKELNNIASNTSFGGENLLDSKSGKFAKGEVTFQIGNTSNETLVLDVKDVLGKVVGTDAGKSTAQAFLKPLNDYQDESVANSGAKTLKDARDTFKTAKQAYEAITGTPNDTQQDTFDKAVAALAKAEKTYVDGMKPLEETAMKAGAGLDSNVLELGLTATTAQYAMGKMEEMMQDMTSVRSSFGANINRLEHTINNLSNMKENTDIATGRIMDADYAEETTNMAKNQMLMESSMSVMARSNQMTGMITQLLR